MGNSADPDRTPHNAVSDKKLYGLLTEIFYLNFGEKDPTPLKLEIACSY